MDSKESTANYSQLSHLISSQALASDMLCTSLIASQRRLFIQPGNNPAEHEIILPWYSLPRWDLP
ncbi:Uncharacterised protein [Klebsiella variicola]|nr:Uncharacterised protein [Klebsiella variicola]